MENIKKCLEGIVDEDSIITLEGTLCTNEVYILCVDGDSNKKYVIKYYRKNHKKDPQYKNKAQREIKTFEFLNSFCKNIPKLLRFGNDENKKYLLLEYIEGFRRHDEEFYLNLTTLLADIHISSIKDNKMSDEFINEILVLKNAETRIKDMRQSFGSLISAGYLDESIKEKLGYLESQILEQDKLQKTFTFNDFGEHNSLYSPLEDKVFIFDFERTSYSLPTMDLACLILTRPESEDKIIDKYVDSTKRLLGSEHEYLTSKEKIKDIIAVQKIEKAAEISYFFLNHESKGFFKLYYNKLLRYLEEL